MEWMYRIDWLAWATFANAVAIVIAATIAGDGFRRWRRQQLFKSAADAATEILLAYYDAERAIAEVRQPLIYGFELDRAKKEIATEPDIRMRDSPVALFNRLLDRKKIWKRAYSLLPTAKALFGEEVHDALHEIVRAQHKLRTTIQIFGDTDSKASEFYDRFHGTAGGAETDPLKLDLVGARARLESRLFPYIRGSETPV